MHKSRENPGWGGGWGSNFCRSYIPGPAAAVGAGEEVQPKVFNFQSCREGGGGPGLFFFFFDGNGKLETEVFFV